jgi:hypothetical protein
VPTSDPLLIQDYRIGRSPITGFDVSRVLRLGAPALAVGFLAFHAGGFFASSTGLLAIAVGLALLLRLTSARSPWEGWSAPLAVAAGALALFCVWLLASSIWSDAAGRALVEFDRALLYLLVLVISGLFTRRRGDLAVVLRWVAAALAVACLAGLATRLFPGEFGSMGAIANDRLTYPLTYWNGMGILGALALVLNLNVTASAQEPPVARVLAAAALPAVVVALYFTFSRGGIAAAVVGLVLYLALAHPRGLLTSLAAVVPTAGLALHQAYGADLLATDRFAQPVAQTQRTDLVGVLVACMAAAALLRGIGLLGDRRLARVRFPGAPRGRARWAVAALAVVLVATATLTTDLPRRLDRQRQAFAEGGILPGQPDLRKRLTQTGNNGRVANWTVAWDAFEAQPWHGSGAGTYRLLWERNRPLDFQVNDGHSLYLETLAEFGAPGLILLLPALLIPLVVAMSRLRRTERHAAGAFLAASVALLLHAGVDWDWELPVLFVWFFAAAGVVLAAGEREGRPRARPPARLTRLVAGLACLVLLLSPALVVASQARLDRSVRAFKRGDCVRATGAALDSLSSLAVRAEPWEIVGYCDARAGQDRLAVAAMRHAQSRDPDNWQYAYGLAVAQALAGEDPRASAARARFLDPREPLTATLVRALRSRSPARRAAAAGRLRIPFE